MTLGFPKKTLLTQKSSEQYSYFAGRQAVVEKLLDTSHLRNMDFYLVPGPKDRTVRDHIWFLPSRSSQSSGEMDKWLQYNVSDCAMPGWARPSLGSVKVSQRRWPWAECWRTSRRAGGYTGRRTIACRGGLRKVRGRWSREIWGWMKKQGPGQGEFWALGAWERMAESMPTAQSQPRFRAGFIRRIQCHQACYPPNYVCVSFGETFQKKETFLIRVLQSLLLSVKREAVPTLLWKTPVSQYPQASTPAQSWAPAMLHPIPKQVPASPNLGLPVDVRQWAGTGGPKGEAAHRKEKEKIRGHYTFRPVEGSRTWLVSGKSSLPFP